MVTTGEQAPSFTAPVATGDVETFALEDALADGPIVLAFFPGAFTSVCTSEMATFQDRLEAFTEAGVAVYGVSIDTPWALNEFRDQLGLSFGLISDTDKEIVERYDVATAFESAGVSGVAERAVFVIDTAGTVTYAWVGEHPGKEPDYDAVEAAAAAAT